MDVAAEVVVLGDIRNSSFIEFNDYRCKAICFPILLIDVGEDYSSFI